MSTPSTSLNIIRLDQPCQVPWETMSGDERRRYCTHCDLHVHNLSAMGEDEAAAFLAMRKGRVCVAYREPTDADGAVPFAATASGLSTESSLPVLPYRTPKPRRRWVVPAAVVTAVATAGATAAIRATTKKPIPTPPAVVRILSPSPAPQMLAGAMMAPPLTQFDPRSGPPACVKGGSAALRSQLKYDALGSAVVQAMPEGLDVVGVNYSVYPPGVKRTSGTVYMLGNPPTTNGKAGDVSYAVWLLPKGADVERDASGDGTDADAAARLRHIATLSHQEVFVDGDADAKFDKALAAKLKDAEKPKVAKSAKSEKSAKLAKR